jgi:hypothetical protein
VEVIDKRTTGWRYTNEFLNNKRVYMKEYGGAFPTVAANTNDVRTLETIRGSQGQLLTIKGNWDRGDNYRMFVSAYSPESNNVPATNNLNSSQLSFHYANGVLALFTRSVLARTSANVWYLQVFMATNDGNSPAVV